MAFNKDKPASTDNYLTEFIPNIQGNFLGLAMFLDSTLSTIAGTLPLGVKRYNRTSQRFEEYNGSAWGSLSLKVTLADTATNVAYSGLTGIAPTWNQSTTGNAATATTLTTTLAVSKGGTGTTTSTGTGSVVLSSSPTLVTPALGTPGSGNLANCTFPTLNQSTTGNAATATTATTAANGVPPGAVIPFAMNSAPTGWLAANGAVVSRTTYAALFAAIGVVYGSGDGSTTFTLPDLRGEFIRGFDASRGIDSGRVFGSSQTDAFKSHTHTHSGWPTAGAGSSGGSGMSIASPNTGTVLAIGATGDGETRPRNIAMTYCIKT